MGTVIYNNTCIDNLSSYDAIGQVDESGIIYTSPFAVSATTAIGQVYDGIVYNKLNAQVWEFAIGHVNYSGIVYTTPVTEYNSDAIGHVNSEGIVYCTVHSEYNSDIVGHVHGPNKKEAAAALLLLGSQLGCSPNASLQDFGNNTGESIVSKAVGLFSDIQFRFLFKNDERMQKACKNCGKKIYYKDYDEQNGFCFRCFIKKGLKK